MVTSRNYESKTNNNWFLFNNRFDPWSLLEGFKNKALSLGVTFIRGEVTGFETRELSVAGGGTEPRSYEKPIKVQVNLCTNYKWFYCQLAN